MAIELVEYPSGTSIETTSRWIFKNLRGSKKLESDLSKEFPGEPIIKNRLSTIGFLNLKELKNSRGPGNFRRIIWRTTLAEVALELSLGENRSIGAER
ncbi:MAG: hypothetical protein CM15mP4_0550 [Candidatus Neomarinimicrobiota bacterium]|nr:MAG: hypothetical protein CM15mP4_0550 [Candidatus Neomarinimicrobiota bacterium]